MKVRLEFDCPDENDGVRVALDGTKYYHCLWEISQYLRKERKYGENEKRVKLFEEVEDEFYQILEDQHIRLDDIL